MGRDDQVDYEDEGREPTRMGAGFDGLNRTDRLIASAPEPETKVDLCHK